MIEGNIRHDLQIVPGVLFVKEPCFGFIMNIITGL